MYDGVTLVGWHRYNDDNSNEDDTGVWEIPQGVVVTGVLEYAKMHTDPDITVGVSLNKRP